MRRGSINRVAKQSRQKGDMLLESMIAMALVGVIAAGPAYITSRAFVTQTQSNMHAQAAMQLRDLLQMQGSALCAGTLPNITVGVTDLAVTSVCTATAAATVTIAGKSIVLAGTTLEKRVYLSVTSAEVFGGSGKIAMSQ